MGNTADFNNEASMTLLEKIGFRKEGCFKKSVFLFPALSSYIVQPYWQELFKGIFIHRSNQLRDPIFTRQTKFVEFDGLYLFNENSLSKNEL